MPPKPDQTGRRASLVPGAALALALALVGVPSAVAQEPTLCDTLDLEQLNALGGPSYAEPLFATDQSCFLEAASDQQGPHSISFWLGGIPFGMTFDEMRDALLQQDPDAEDAEVAGFPAVVDRVNPDGTNVSIGLDERALTVFTSVAQSAEVGDLDESEYALAVAELVIAGLPAPADGGDGTASLAEPPAVEGIAWRTARSFAGAEIEEGSADVELQLWERLLAASGASFSQASMVDSTAFDAAADERLGSYQTIRIEGSDASGLAPVVEGWLADLQGEGFEATPVTLAGRDVTQVSLSGEVQGFIYGQGDTLHLLSLPAAIAEMIVAALP